jgi:hypothetical protein
VVLQQHPDFKTLMGKLCKELSKVSMEDDAEITAIFLAKLNHAINQ